MGLTKRPDGYYVEFRVMESEDGRTLRLAGRVPGTKVKRWKVGTANKAAAKQLEATIRTNIMLGKVATEEARPILFGEWAQNYLQLEEVLRLRSYQDRLEIVTRQLIPYFGNRLLTEIKADDVRAFRTQRKLRTGKPASLQTVNNDHIVLKHCLNVAMKRGLLIINPATKVPMPNPHNERDRILSAEEWQKLHAVAKPHLRPILLLAYQLGQRLSEIIDLTWDRVDLKRGFITLRSMDTKTKKPRQVPLTPDVKVELQRLAKVRSLASRNVFLYKGESFKRITTAFNKAKKDAEVQDFRFHDLRHCAATNLRRAGCDTATAMQIVGHTSDRMWKRYQSIQDSDLTKAAEMLNTYLKCNTLITLDPDKVEGQ